MPPPASGGPPGNTGGDDPFNPENPLPDINFLRKNANISSSLKDLRRSQSQQRAFWNLDAALASSSAAVGGGSSSSTSGAPKRKKQKLNNHHAANNAASQHNVSMNSSKILRHNGSRGGLEQVTMVMMNGDDFDEAGKKWLEQVIRMVMITMVMIGLICLINMDCVRVTNSSIHLTSSIWICVRVTNSCHVF